MDNLSSNNPVEVTDLRDISDYGDWQAELTAALNDVVIIDQRRRDRLEFNGADTGSFLNRLLSFAIQDLSVGEGARPFMLNARGRIVLTFTCLKVAEDAFIVDAIVGHGGEITTRIDMFHFGEDFRMDDISESTSMLTVAGAGAARLLESLQLPLPDTSWSHVETRLNGAQLRIVNAPRTSHPTFDIWCASDEFDALWAGLTEAGALPCGQRAFDALRVIGGVPQHPSEFGEHTTPLDSGGHDGLTDGKGCYPGQEVIERTLALGRPALTLVSVLSTETIEVGSKLMNEDRDVGTITSGVALPNEGWIGLALIKTRFSKAAAWHVGQIAVTPRPAEA
jgi:tRNA-modifying protein YgfZ